jgi:hypothetical protein
LKEHVEIKILPLFQGRKSVLLYFFVLLGTSWYFFEVLFPKQKKNIPFLGTEFLAFVDKTTFVLFGGKNQVEKRTSSVLLPSFSVLLRTSRWFFVLLKYACSLLPYFHGVLIEFLKQKAINKITHFFVINSIIDPIMVDSVVE